MGSKNTRKADREITLQELAKHNSSSDAWIAINGKVYDVTDYIPRHPGGRSTIMQGIGRDATAMFNQAHNYVDPAMNLPKDKLVGTLKR